MTYMSAGVNYFDAESRHLQAPPHLAASLHTCKHLQDDRIVICKAIGPGMHRISSAGVNTFMTSPVIHRDRSLPRTLLPGSTYPQDDWHVLTNELDKENVPYAVISHVTPAEIVI